MLAVVGMHDAVISLVLLAGTLLALAITRRRPLMIRIAVESGLLLVIGLFLLAQGTSPVPQLGGIVIGLAGAWPRALAAIWWLIGARLAVNITLLVRGHDPRSRGARLFSDLAAAVIYIATGLIIFNAVLGLNVSGLLATSGVIAIVLGLALQNTLADVFFGLAINLEQPFHLGDRVSVGDGTEGVVVQMNWRSVRIHSDGDDLVTIPNSIVAKGQIINRSVPTRRRAAKIEIVVPSEIDADTVFTLMRQATLLCPELLPAPAPSISISRVGLHSSTYAASFFVADSPALSAAKSMILQQIQRVFRHAGVGQAKPMTSADLLGSLALFEALSRDQLAALERQLITHFVGPDETIFEQGAESTSIYVVAAGVMEIRRHAADTGDTSLGRIGPGDYIGELGLITGMPRAFTIAALTRGRVLELPGSSLIALMQANATLHEAIERSVQRGLAQLERDDAARSAQPAQQDTHTFARIRAFFGMTMEPLPASGVERG